MWHVLLVFVALAQAADAITLAIGAPIVGIHAEQNPIARLAYIDWGVWGALAYKAILVGAMLALITYFGRDRRRRVLLAAIAGGLGLVGAFGNVLAILAH